MTCDDISLEQLITPASTAPTAAFALLRQNRFNAANTSHDGKLTLT